MRLICPRCGAQYEIDATAIPASGRDVECSACDHVWRASPEAAPFDADARPQLSRPLSESVIEILRAEAARELEVRDAERRTRRAAERAGELAAGLAGPNSGAEARGAPPQGTSGSPDGTAAEVVGDGSGLSAGPPDAAAARSAGAASLADASGAWLAHGSDLDEMAAVAAGPDEATGFAAQDGTGPADAPDPSPGGVDAGSGKDSGPAIAQAMDPSSSQGGPGQPDVHHAGPAQALPHAPRVPARRRRNRSRKGYAAGFGIAVMVALAAVWLYALAPRLADQGPPGAALAEWRTQVDHGREWLARQGAAVTGGLRGFQAR